MAYTLSTPFQPDENGVYRKHYCKVVHGTDPDGWGDYPNQQVETEFEYVTDPAANDAAQALDDAVQANPALYFGG